MIIYNNDLNKEKLNNFYTKDVFNSFKNSTYYLFAYDDDKLIGGLRVLSDNREWTIIYDLKVDNNYKNFNIYQSLVIKIIEKYGHHIFAYGNNDDIDIYEKLLFKRSKTAFIVDNKNKYNDSFLPNGFKYENEFRINKLPFPIGLKTDIHRNSNIEYRNIKDSNYDRINEILSSAFRRNVDVNITKYTFSNSDKYAFAYDDGLLVGVARALTDEIENAIILNVAVDPNYQGLHIGLNLIDTLKNQLEGQRIFLNTHPGGVGFYNRDGFKRCKLAFQYVGNMNVSEEIDSAFNLPFGFRFIDEL